MPANKPRRAGSYNAANDGIKLRKGCRVAGYGTITRWERVTSEQGCHERVPYPATRYPHHPYSKSRFF